MTLMSKGFRLRWNYRRNGYSIQSGLPARNPFAALLNRQIPVRALNEFTDQRRVASQVFA